MNETCMGNCFLGIEKMKRNHKEENYTFYYIQIENFIMYNKT